jgi:hypothetical protein
MIRTLACAVLLLAARAAGEPTDAHLARWGG